MVKGSCGSGWRGGISVAGLAFLLALPGCDGNNPIAPLSRRTPTPAPSGARILVEPTRLDFGTTVLGSTSERALAVRSRGNAALRVTSVSIPGGPFAVAANLCLGRTLAPQESCTILLAFAPPRTGPFVSAALISSSDPRESVVLVELIGSGVPAPAGATPAPAARTPSPTPRGTPAVTPTATPAVTPTATPAATPTATPAATPTATPAATPTATPAATPTATPAATPTATPTPSTGACCTGVGCFILAPAACTAAGGVYQGGGSSCTPSPCPTGACCTGFGCQVTSPTACGTLAGSYRGDGTACTPSPCGTGACCSAFGCQVTSQALCDTLAGSYGGDGSTCTPSPCLLPTGACCTLAGCFEVTGAGCALVGGTYQGNGSSCSPDPC